MVSSSKRIVSKHTKGRGSKGLFYPVGTSGQSSGPVFCLRSPFIRKLIYSQALRSSSDSDNIMSYSGRYLIPTDVLFLHTLWKRFPYMKCLLQPKWLLSFRISNFPTWNLRLKDQGLDTELKEETFTFRIKIENTYEGYSHFIHLHISHESLTDSIVLVQKRKRVTTD